MNEPKHELTPADIQSIMLPERDFFGPRYPDFASVHYGDLVLDRPGQYQGIYIVGDLYIASPDVTLRGVTADRVRGGYPKRG